MLNMFRMLVHPSSGAWDLFVELFHGLYCSGLMCVGVTVWFSWGGVVSLCRLKQCFSLHKDTTPPRPNHTVTPTHIEPEQYNTWNKYKISRNLLKMDVLTLETCWTVNGEIKKWHQVGLTLIKYNYSFFILCIEFPVVRMQTDLCHITRITLSLSWLALEMY